jgi:hypothetical protein
MNNQYNIELYKIYSKLHEKLPVLVDTENKKNDNPTEWATNPLFLYADDDYINSEIKIMLFGKETNSWHDKNKLPYGSREDFIVDDIINLHYGFPVRTFKRSVFFRGFSLLINKIEGMNRTRKIGFMWNNLVKMGMQKRGFPHKLYPGVIKPHLNTIIPEEIKILKPNFLVFFTGPDNYDKVLNDIFNNPKRNKIANFNERQLCEIEIPRISKALRTYHPNYLFKTGNDNVDKYYDCIATEITNGIKRIK